MTFTINPPATPTFAGTADRIRSNSATSAGLLQAARPQQWLKNGAVLIVPGLSILALTGGQMLAAIGAVLAFSLAASSVYLLNDTLDRHNDAQHPTKQFRPIASGVVSPSVALGAPLASATAALVLGAVVSTALAIVVALYLAITAAYSVKLKHIAIVDVAVLSLGFVLRVVAGAVAVGLAAPALLLVSVFWASVFIALDKRRSEAMLLGDNAASHRPALRVYTIPFIDTSLLDSQLISVLAFGAWIFIALHSAAHRMRLSTTADPMA